MNTRGPFARNLGAWPPNMNNAMIEQTVNFVMAASNMGGGSDPTPKASAGGHCSSNLGKRRVSGLRHSPDGIYCLIRALARLRFRGVFLV
jgi:hypothetical protein